MSSTISGSEDVKYPGDFWGQWGHDFRRFDTSMANDLSLAVVSAANNIVPLSHSTGLMDIACGRGGNLIALFSKYGQEFPSSAPISAIDSSPGMIEQIRERLAVEAPSWSKHVKAYVEDAADLKTFKDGSFSHVLSTSGLYLMPPAVFTEAYRITAPNGVMVMTSMVKVGWMDFMSPISQVKPGMSIPQLPVHWTTKEGVTKTLKDAGFRDVKVETIEMGMPYEDPEEIATFLIRSMPWVPEWSSGLTEEEKKRWVQLCVDKVRNEYTGGVIPGTVLIASGRK